jgi:hypothetical protein
LDWRGITTASLVAFQPLALGELPSSDAVESAMTFERAARLKLRRAPAGPSGWPLLVGVSASVQEKVSQYSCKTDQENSNEI